MRMGMQGFIPAKILTDKSLSDGDKIMFAIITAHADENNQVKEDEEYFASIRGVDPRTIRSQISQLVKAAVIYRKSDKDKKVILEIASAQYFSAVSDLVVQTTKQILDYWNSVMGADIPYTTVLERLIRRRLRRFTPEELVRAVQGRISFVKTNPWFDRPENKAFKLKIDTILHSDEEVEKYRAEPIADTSIIQIPVDEKVKSFDAKERNQAILE